MQTKRKQEGGRAERTRTRRGSRKAEEQEVKEKEMETRSDLYERVTIRLNINLPKGNLVVSCNLLGAQSKSQPIIRLFLF